MHADLERLIDLQRIDSAIREAEHTLAGEPARLQSLDGRLGDARAHVDGAREAMSRNATARREIEKDVALHQGRLSKFRDQAMNVKTNQGDHAIQHEIAFAQNEIKAHEDRMLERMMESDELTAGLKAAEGDLTLVQKDVESGKKAIAAEHDQLREKVQTLKAERTALIHGLSPEAL